jgi:nucleoside-diphosphate-sugar epimerase
MNKLIFGCCYLGERVGRRSLDAGDRVWVTTRSPEKAERFRALGFVPILCDILRPESLGGLPRVDTILYAIAPDGHSDSERRQVYVDGLKNVLDSLVQLGAGGRFLYVSSTSVYGQTDGSWVDESAPTEPTLDSGRIMVQAEERVRARPDLNPVILRFAGIYGPGRLIKAEALRKGEPIDGAPDRWLNLIHIDDGVSAVLAAEKCGTPGAVCNVSDGTPVLRRGFYEWLATRLDCPRPRFAPQRGVESANRRIANQRMTRELAVTLLRRSYREGLGELLGSDPKKP